jgi:hypothetical protein
MSLRKLVAPVLAAGMLATAVPAASADEVTVCNEAENSHRGGYVLTNGTVDPLVGEGKEPCKQRHLIPTVVTMALGACHRAVSVPPTHAAVTLHSALDRSRTTRSGT